MKLKHKNFKSENDSYFLAQKILLLILYV